jgi:hypothetical protein
MRKLTVLAALAAVMIAAPMFAARRLITVPNATFATGAPTTTNNDDSCDIGTTPAATLLLPYFNVDFGGGNTANTVFTIVNTSRFPQIAHVVLWTDWSFAALDFNIFLTGYDVQSISLRDIFANGQIAPTATGAAGGTSVTGSVNGPGTGTSPTLATVQTRNGTTGGAPGSVPANNTNSATAPANNSNPNFSAAVGGSGLTGCINLPGPIPTGLLTDLRTIFTTGAPGAIIGASCTGSRLGGTHANAIGYATIDVASNCTTNLPGPTYFTGDILFDNTLTGDYEQIVPGTSGGLTNASGGSPLVHIRAIPEGGASGSTPGTNLPFTFYDRYTGTAAGGNTGRTVDRRQPLPNTFAARWIQGGTGGFNTNFQIWREGLGAPDGTGTFCGTSPAGVDLPEGNSALAIRDEVRFDEFENAVGVTIASTVSPAVIGTPALPEASSTPTSAGGATGTSAPFPPAVTASNPSGSAAIAGWMYLNLANNGTPAGDAGQLTFQTGRGGGATTGGTFGPATGLRTTTQNWVTVNMQASPTFSALFDATWLGNGCTPAPLAGASIGTAVMRPATGSTATATLLICPPPLVINSPSCPSTSYQLPTPTP